MTNTTTQNTKAHVQMLKTFDTVEFEARLEKAKSEYLEGYYNDRQWMYPAAIIESMPTLQMLLELVIQKEKDGQPLYPHGEQAEGIPGYYKAQFWKPKTEIEADLEALKLKVEQEYKAEIESWNASQVELLASQLYEAEKKKAEDAEKKKEEKAKAKALEEAQTYFASITKEGQ